MDWSDLPYFLAVARTGQIARAAALMGSDATTVGRRIRRLERATGERLFEQTNEGQMLTPAGVALFDKAEAMDRIAGGIGDGAPGSAPRGTVRVSVAEGFGTWFVSRHIGEFAAAYPQIEIDLVASSGFLNPTRRETDLAVLLARPRRGPLVTRKLADYRLGLYAARALVDPEGGIAAPADLARHRLVGYIPDIVYAPELRYWEELPIGGAPTLRSSSINAQHRMIASGAGVGVLPCFIGDADPALTRILPDLAIERSFWLVSHRETRAFTPVARFAEWLIGCIQRHGDALDGRGKHHSSPS